MEIIRDLGFGVHEVLYKGIAQSAAVRHESLSAAIRRLIMHALAEEGITVPPYPTMPRNQVRAYLPSHWAKANALLSLDKGLTWAQWWKLSQMPRSSFFRMLRRSVLLGEAEKRSDGLYYRVMPMTQNGNEVPVRDPSTT